MTETAVLLINCPDQRGIVAAVSALIARHEGNIVHAYQHKDAELGLFFMRVEWDLSGFAVALERFGVVFDEVAARFGMIWRLARSSARPRVAVLVSKYDHCLADLLYRWRCGELRCELALVVGNHPDGRELAEFYGVPFHHFAIARETRDAVEAEERALFARERIDLLVLARYMQVLSPAFVSEYRNRIINVHHSFLPAFIGARPYHQAYQRGVKLIGATSHYVTEQLDDGPIIEQSTTRISHRDQLDDLLQKGRELEKEVLSRAVRWHTENRILIHGNKTVIFD